MECWHDERSGGGKLMVSWWITFLREANMYACFIAVDQSIYYSSCPGHPSPVARAASRHRMSMSASSSCHHVIRSICRSIHTSPIKADMVGTNSSRDNRITLVAAASFAAGVVVASVVFRRREKRRRKVSRLNGEQTVVMADDSIR